MGNKIHQSVAIIINLIIISFLINIAWEGNDKAILILLLFYPVLILVNSIVWLILGLMRRAESRIYKVTTIGLIVLFVPALLISSLY